MSIDDDDDESRAQRRRGAAGRARRRARSTREQSRAGGAPARGVAALPPAQRDAFLLQQESGLSLAEIAALQGVGVETVKSRLRYAVARLRMDLGSWTDDVGAARSGAVRPWDDEAGS